MPARAVLPQSELDIFPWPVSLVANTMDITGDLDALRDRMVDWIVRLRE